MKTIWILTLALTLALASLTPALAEEAPAETVPADLELLLDQAEQPNMTPAEEPEAPDLLGLEEAQRVNRIRACEPNEEAQCPPGCACVVIRNAVNCFC